MPFSQTFTNRRKTYVIPIVLVITFLSFLFGLIIGLQKGMQTASKNPIQTGATGTEALYQGNVRGIGGKPPSGVAEDVDFTIFWDVWHDLKTGFYDQPVPEKKLFYGALKGMAEALADPYTTYFEPVTAEEFMTSLKGEFSGIGAEIGSKDGELQIIAPLPDSPANRAGVRARDLIIKIDGIDSLSMPIDEAVQRIRGPKGTTVSLLLGRRLHSEDAEDVSVTTTEVVIVRDTIVVKSVLLEEKEDGIYRLNIHNFNSNSMSEFAAAIDTIRSGNPKGIIVDVRNNPGGYLDRAVQMTGEWLDQDIVVQSRERGVITEQYRGAGNGKLRGIPTVVLVNEGSASASEILAGALQDYGIAIIVGKQTFGKGSVQDFKEYEDGSALKYTVAEWLTPNGRSINKEGIMPDVEVDYTEQDFNAERDPQLEKAINLLKDWTPPKRGE